MVCGPRRCRSRSAGLRPFIATSWSMTCGEPGTEPELCPDVAAQPLGLRADTSDAERERRLNEAGRQCVANLKRDGIDPHFFNTRVNAEDLIDLRKVLGYESWDVFGVSYGARLAQEAMRRDPKAAHSAILASPWIPGVAKAEDPLSVARIVEQIFAACGAQLACRSDFPSPKQDLDELYAELNAKPMEVVVQRGGSQATVVLDGHGLISRLAGRFTAAQINRLPLLLHELRRGDRAAAARLLVGDGLGPTVGNALQSLFSAMTFGAPITVVPSKMSGAS